LLHSDYLRVDCLTAVTLILLTAHIASLISCACSWPWKRSNFYSASIFY